MQHATILIQRKGEPFPLEFKTPPPIIELAHMVVTEGGMKSGATSLTFHVVGPDGKSSLFQMSALIFQGMSDAFRGAEAYFKASGIDKEAVPEGFGITKGPAVIENDKPIMKDCPNDPDKKGSCIHCVKMVGGCPHRK